VQCLRAAGQGDRTFTATQNSTEEDARIHGFQARMLHTCWVPWLPPRLECACGNQAGPWMEYKHVRGSKYNDKRQGRAGMPHAVPWLPPKLKWLLVGAWAGAAE
jgi:hypothetical protein